MLWHTVIESRCDEVFLILNCIFVTSTSISLIACCLQLLAWHQVWAKQNVKNVRFTGRKCYLKHMWVEMPYHEVQKPGACIADFIHTNEALIVRDWAMKFLFRKYREGKTDYLPKEASAIISVWFYLKTKYNTEIPYTWGSFSQHSSVTVSILVDVIVSIHGISKINFWTDNIWCYKSSLTFSILYQEFWSRLHLFNFCEAQAGKGECASHFKSSIKRYINEGHGATCAADMKMVGFLSPWQK